MISIGISVITVIGVLAVQRYKTDANSDDIKSNRKACSIQNEKMITKLEDHNKEDDNVHNSMFKKLDTLSEKIAEHKIQLANAPTMEMVRTEFVSKEMFKQMEKHMDEKFTKLENGIEKILEKLNSRG